MFRERFIEYSYPRESFPLIKLTGTGCMWHTFVALLRNERGATAIEYGLIAALVSITAISAFRLVGTNLSRVFNTVATNL